MIKMGGQRPKIGGNWPLTGPYSAGKVLQISSDGPNLNMAFLYLVKESTREDLLDPLFHTGTCNLHMLHCSFQNGEKVTD